MLSISLLIPEPSLHEAVAEQIKISASGTIEPTATLSDQLFSERTAIILDEAACDAKTIKKLQAIRGDKMILLLLGNPPDGADADLFTEIFAKPVRLGHLMARLHFYSEIAPRLRSTPLAIGPYRLEAQQRSLILGEDIIRLTEKETALLEYLAQSENPVSRDELLASVWGYDARIDTHTLETHIYQLRRKLGGDKAERELIIHEDGLYRLKS